MTTMTSTARIVTVALATVVGVAGLKVILTAQHDQDAQQDDWNYQDDQDGSVAHVLLLSVDGLHGFDIERFIANNPQSTLARLRKHRRLYTNPTARRPFHSFPCLPAMLTGSTLRSTACYYDY